MNMYLFELRKKLPSTLIWGFSIGFFTWISFTMFTSFANQAFTAVLDNFPDALKKAFGLEGDISSVLGYFAFIGSFTVLCGAIFASNLGLTAVSVEESDLTADFLIAKPVNRTSILLAKYLGATTHIFLFTLITSVISLVSIEAYRGGQTYEFGGFLLMTGGLFFVQLLFFAMGLFISLCLRRMDSPLPFSMGISFGLYIINSFDTLIDDTFIKYLIPFNYFDLVAIAETTSYKTFGILLWAFVWIGFSLWSFIAYNKRDIATAM